MGIEDIGKKLNTISVVAGHSVETEQRPPKKTGVPTDVEGNEICVGDTVAYAVTVGRNRRGGLSGLEGLEKFQCMGCGVVDEGEQERETLRLCGLWPHRLHS